MVYGCILQWQSVTYHFGSLTLSSDLVSGKIVSRAAPILVEVGISNLVYGCISEWQCSILFLGL